MQTVRGVGLPTAATVAAEVSDFGRSVRPRPLMAHAGRRRLPKGAVLLSLGQHLPKGALARLPGDGR
jgi:hypothetical protein